MEGRNVLCTKRGQATDAHQQFPGSRRQYRVLFDRTPGLGHIDDAGRPAL